MITFNDIASGKIAELSESTSLNYLSVTDRRNLYTEEAYLCANELTVDCEPLKHYWKKGIQYLLEYLYTAQCSIPVSELDDVSRYASQLKMHDFVDLLNHEFSVFTEWSKLKVSYSYISLRLTHF